MQFGKSAILSALLLTVSTTCFAQVSCEVGNNEVIVNGDYGADFAFKDVSLEMTGPFSEIIDKDNTESSLESVQNGNPLTNTVFNEKKADGEGKIVYKFYPAADNRFYIISVRMDGEDEAYREVILNVSQTLEGNITDLLNAAKDANGIKAVFDTEDYYNALVYKYGLFTKVKNAESKLNIYKGLFKAKEEKPFDGLSGSYADAIMNLSAIQLIAESSDAALAKQIAREYLDLSFDETNPADYFYKQYSEFSEDIKTNVFRRIIGKNIADETAWREKFEEAVFLQLIENERYSTNIYTVINTYAEKFGVDMTKYNLKKTQVNAALHNKYFADIAALNTAISNAAKGSAENPVRGGGNGGSSSGSGNKGNSVNIRPSGTVIENTAASAVFNDLESVPWAKEAVEALYAKQIVSGDGAGNFNPDRAVTREEFLKMLVTAMGMLDSEASHSFEDSSEDAWHYRYIASGVKNGVVTGISDTLFGVGMSVTRQDMAVMLQRAAKIDAVSDYDAFADDAEISDYAKDAVYALRNRAVINGKDNNRFAPSDNATRAEAAKVIYGLISE